LVLLFVCAKAGADITASEKTIALAIFFIVPTSVVTPIGANVPLSAAFPAVCEFKMIELRTVPAAGARVSERTRRMMEEAAKWRPP
jgi:hypothetical protein